jgi:hypothetical protein
MPTATPSRPRYHLLILHAHIIAIALPVHNNLAMPLQSVIDAVCRYMNDTAKLVGMDWQYNCYLYYSRFNFAIRLIWLYLHKHWTIGS